MDEQLHDAEGSALVDDTTYAVASAPIDAPEDDTPPAE
jgi:hypothetical protein